jgi:predicted nicotinamide N-methyase
MVSCFKSGLRSAGDDTLALFFTATYSKPSLAMLPEDLMFRYRPLERTVFAGSHAFTLLAVPDTNGLLEQIDPATFAEDERLPYWSEIWTSALGLAAYCVGSPMMRGAAVLELGCGLGLAGIAAAAAGARVMMTDYEPDALAFSRWNVERNLPGALASGRVDVRLMDWRSPLPGPPFDLIIGADVAYERRNFLPLLRTVDQLLTGSGMAIFTDPDRSTGGDFATLAALQGFGVNTVREPAPRHDATRILVRYELRRETSS